MRFAVVNRLRLGAAPRPIRLGQFIIQASGFACGRGLDIYESIGGWIPRNSGFARDGLGFVQKGPFGHPRRSVARTGRKIGYDHRSFRASRQDGEWLQSIAVGGWPPRGLCGSRDSSVVIGAHFKELRAALRRIIRHDMGVVLRAGLTGGGRRTRGGGIRVAD